ncbi:reductase [Biomphalaria glabrata]|uniref:Uncharacterized protein LOC106063487 n=1 Tax=Biomphalaria glabrata TaxID=6526 RepID=A0A9U8E984_BIOGL|nr:uncharacterized protein LOC106063487 [Biomphalaria glabrata]KAI8751235.1 putative reductase; partial [Biomphalaria glabrata]
MASIVLVTDATSFTSSHIIKQLQEEGYQVRGTVTSLQDEETRIKLLQELVPEAKYKLEVVEADPAKSETWESAMKDVQHVIHAIKPAAALPPAAEGEAPVQPAVEAVQNIFKASVVSKTVKRIVLTSSYQAITAAPTAATDKVFTEADWADAETADPLTKSIILAEKSAWDFVKELTDADKIDLCVMNPTLPLGPPLLDAQQDVVKMILDRGITGCPRVSYSLVDVRDVAAAHVKALALDVSGHRHILHGGNLWMKDIALALAKEYKPQGYSIHTMSLPNVALWGLSLFNKNAKTFLPIVGKQSQFDNTRMKDVLGISPKDVKETIMEEASVLIEKGLVKKPKRTRCQGGGAAAADNEAKTEEATEKKEGEGEDKPKENGDVKEEEAEKKEDQEESKGDGKVEEKKEEEAKSDADKAAVDEVKTEAPEESTEAKAEN